MMTENNEKKRFGRRAGIGIAAIGLITLAFYVIIFTFKSSADILKVGLDLFGNYTTTVIAIAGFIIGGLSVTDIWARKKE